MGTLRPFSLFDIPIPGVPKGVLPPLWMETDAALPAVPERATGQSTHETADRRAARRAQRSARRPSD